MRIRSYVDLTLFVIFVQVDARQYGDDFRDLARTLQPTRGTDVGALLEALRHRAQRTIDHEGYHFWQGLRLPFLNLYANQSLREVNLFGRELSRMSSEWRQWTEYGAVLPILNRLDFQRFVRGDDFRTLEFYSGETPGKSMALAFSAKDMLEAAASIFDFHNSRASIADLSSPKAFAIWRRRNPASLKLFDYVARSTASETVALRTLLPMINAAFHTSFPERAFVELLARTVVSFCPPTGDYANFLTQKEPCRWTELYQLWLRDLKYDLEFGKLPESVSLLDTKYYYLDPQRWIGLRQGGTVHHPILGPLSREWMRREKTTPGLESALDLPGYLNNPAAWEFLSEAAPQLRIVRVLLGDEPDKVFAVGEGLVRPAFESPDFASFSDSEFRGFLIDQMAICGAVRRAGADGPEDTPRNCYHAACPEYAANYCNCYPLIPSSFEACGFAARLDEWVAVVRS